MNKNALVKWLILAFLLCVSLWAVTPPKKKIPLGLDIAGGTAFTIKIDEARLRAELIRRDPALADEVNKGVLDRQFSETMKGIDQRTVEVLRSRVDGLGINEPIIEVGNNHTILLQLPGTDDDARREAREQISSAAHLEFRLVAEQSEAWVAELFDKGMAPEGYEIVDLAELGIRGRGGEVYVRSDDFSEIKRDVPYQVRLGRFGGKRAIYEFMLQSEQIREVNMEYFRPAYVFREVEMTGQDIKKAGVSWDNFNRPQVSLEFNARGAIDFGNITRKYAPRGTRNRDSEEGRRLAIVLDGELKSSPAIQVPILDGKASITGSFTEEEAKRLSNVLEAGSLPAPVEILSELFVDPSLGKDSLNSGIRAIMVGGVAVLVFMMVYYSYCGVVANLALLLDMLLLPVGMLVAGGFLGLFARDASSSGGLGSLPVLTLPGIAGILLTIGMAVDANVLIFERIREESRSGKRLRSAIDAGYDRAFITIVDANITTLLTAVILFIFGSGPIRGFAVTLSAGIMVSMLTALMFTHLLFNATVKESREKAFKMLSIIKEKTSIDFVGKRKMAAIFSIVVIAATWSIFGVQAIKTPNKVFGVDFTGGTAMILTFEKKGEMDAVRKAIDDAVPGSMPQYQKEAASGNEFLRVKCPVQTVAAEGAEGEIAASLAIENALQKALPESKWDFKSEERVSAQVGKTMKLDAVKAIALALVVIVLYISIRFEFGFALGAIVALAHDVLFTTGVFTLMGNQISLPIIAALLTIVGYSVNDTIVVFDRIREDLKLDRKMNFADICNLSINQTLSRTLLTSVTTLIAVLSLVILGGGAIFDFALALLIGIIVGTYSSIFVATPVVLLFYRFKKPGFATKKK